MEVSEKVYSPSVPADNGVNEMRYQVAKIYTALNIEVCYQTLHHVFNKSVGKATRERRRATERKRSFDERNETLF